MNDEDREEWVLNDEGLYEAYLAWRRKTGRRSALSFAKEHRELIDETANNIIDGRNRQHYLKYG